MASHRSPSHRPSARSPEHRGRRLALRTLAVVALATSVAYLVWRATQTLEPSALWLSLPMLLVEVHAVVCLALFVYSLWDLDAVTPPAPVDDTDLRVAVLIPTYNEPEEVLLPTIAAAVALRPAHETWVLDDGDRPEVRALAEELGASYLTRPDRRDAKAGNLNHALEVVDADLLAILDADHVAAADLLRNTLGYFDDPRVALVQTPQDFYNAESFEHVNRRRGLSRGERQTYSEQSLFYRVIQAGKNRWDAAFWCGTGALVRTSALRSIGGVATGSVTEDIQTTIRLHRAGWRTAYHNEVLAQGLAAATLEQYALQRHRWCTGAMQVLRRERPLTGPGLSARQRVAYAATLLGWFDAWRMLAYLLLPVAVLLSGAAPVRAPWQVFAAWFGITFALQHLALWRLGRGYSRPVPATIFELMRLTPILQATTVLVRGGATEFRVTPKGRAQQAPAGGSGGGRVLRRPPAPPLLVGILLLSAVAALWYAATLAGLTPLTYGVLPVVHGAFAWLVLNAALLLAAIRRSRAVRYAGDRRASVRFDAAQGVLVDDRLATLLDVSLTGARLESTADTGPAVGGVLRLEVALSDGPLALPCRTRLREEAGDGRVRLGVEFEDVPVSDRARLALWAFDLARDPAAAHVVPGTLPGTLPVGMASARTAPVGEVPAARAPVATVPTGSR